MTLQSSGAISLNDVNIELGYPGTATISMDNTLVRSTFGKTTALSAISMSDGYGKIFTTNGQLWLWGNNSNGELGTNNTTSRSSPVQTISAGSNWRLTARAGISSGGGLGRHTAVIKTDGTLWTWGLGTSGQLGSNAVSSRSSPTQTVLGGTTWQQVAHLRLATLSIKTDSSLWGMGRNASGSLAMGNTTSYSSPVQSIYGTGWTQIAAGIETSIGIKTTGTLWAWGIGDAGELGNNAVASRSSPVQTVAGGTNWTQCAAGPNISTNNFNSTMAAVKSDGTLWTWGGNIFGQLGINAAGDRSSPTQVVGNATNWKLVAVGDAFMGAVKTDGTLWMWGYGNGGNLGTNSTPIVSSPLQVVGNATNWKQVACGDQVTAAIKTDGTLWTWGQAYSGQLGTNDAAGRSSPIQTVSGGTNWSAVSVNARYMFAIKI